MTAVKATKETEFRMSAAEIDRVMGKALQVKPQDAKKRKTAKAKSRKSRRAMAKAHKPYWVFVAPTVKWARVHRSECRHCRNGEGQIHQLKETPRTATEFHGFDTRSEAVAYMNKRKMPKSGLCGTCKP